MKFTFDICVGILNERAIFFIIIQISQLDIQILVTKYV